MPPVRPASRRDDLWSLPTTRGGRQAGRRQAMFAFLVGLLLALAASGGIAGERVARGTFSVDLLASTAVTLAAILAATATTRHLLRDAHDASAALVASQVVGAGVGVALVHLVLRNEAAALPWLSERPAQFVNDVAAVAGVLTLVWACVRGLDVRLLVLALAGLTLYRLTASRWHLDHAAFAFTIQELVVAQLVAAAIGLGVFRATADRA